MVYVDLKGVDVYDASTNEASSRSRADVAAWFLDHDYDGDPSQYRQIPHDFGRFHFGRAPAGDPDSELLTTLTAEIRNMRRFDAV